MLHSFRKTIYQWSAAPTGAAVFLEIDFSPLNRYTGITLRIIPLPIWATP